MAKRPTKKPTDSNNILTDASWLDATVMIGEREQTRTTFSGSVRNLALMRRAMSGTPYQACSLNATACANQPMRLLMPERAAKSHGIAYRSVGGTNIQRMKYQAYLRGEGTVRPTRKSMEYVGSTGEMVEVTEHPVLDLIRKPDPEMTGHDFTWFSYFCRQACGESYAWIGQRENGVPARMYTLFPQFAWPVIGQEELIGAFRYGRNSSSIIELNPADVIYIRQHPHPELPTRGYSWLESVAMYSDTENAAVQAEIARWRNGGNPSGIFKLGDDTTEEQMRQFRASVRAQVAGVQKQGEYLYVKSAEIIGSSKPHEMQYIEGLEMSSKRVYDAAGVPESLYRLNSSNLSSAAAGNRQYMMYTIYPTIRAAAEQLTEELLPRFGIMPGEMFFTCDNPVEEDVNEEASRMLAGMQMGGVRPNEYRRVLGLEPLDDTLNKLRINGVQIEDVPQPTLQEAKKDETVGEPALTSDSKDSGREEQAEDTESTKSISSVQRAGVADANTVQDQKCVCDGVGCGEVKPELTSKAAGPLPNVMMVYLRRMYEDIKSWYVRVYRDLIGFDPGDVSVTPSMMQELELIIRYSGGSTAAGGAANIGMQPGFLAAFAEASGLRQPGGLVTIGAVDAVFDLPNDWAVEYAKRRGLELAKSVPETIQADVRSIIAASIEQGQTTEQLQRAIFNRVPEIVEYQARRLAITETSFAFNGGAVERLKEAGLMGQWRLDPTLDNCPQCVAISEDPRNESFDPSEGAFDPTTGSRVFSPVHPHCGCMILAVVDFAEPETTPIDVEAMA